MSTQSIRREIRAEILPGLSAQRARMTIKDRVTQAFVDWRDDLYRYALSLGLNSAEAQEITQDAFLRLYVSLDEGEGIENQKAWLFRVTHNLALNLRVKENRLGPWTADLEGRVIDPGANPEQAFLENEKLQRMHRAVEGLSEQQRHCLKLRAEGFRYREIGEILGIRTSTVNEFLKRAVRLAD